MKTFLPKLSQRSILILLFFISLSCKEEEVDLSQDIKTIVLSVPNLPLPPERQEAKLIATNPTDVTDNSVKYTCSKKTYSYANNMSEMISLNPNAGTLYPGALVQGKFLIDGELNSIGDFPRRPLKVTLENYGLEKTVDIPTDASVNQAILKMVSENTAPTIAQITYKQVEAFSSEQAFLELGIDYKWIQGSISPSFGNKKSISENSVIIAFTQAYYTVSVTQPSSPSDFFAEGTNVQDLKNKITSDNPLCYLSSVTYGRVLFAKITSNASTKEITSAIKASLGPADGKLTYTTSKTLENSSIEVSISGGNSTDAANVATKGMSGIADYINKGANFSTSSLGLPISYTVRHASDNSIVKLGKALEYTVNDDCFYDPAGFTKFSIKIDKFYIEKDCDNGILTNTGPGEFTFKIDVKDNNRLLKAIEHTQIASVNDGEDLIVDAGPYDVIVTNQASHKLTLTGILYEDDGDLKNELKIPDIEFSFPFTQITSDYKSFYQTIDYGSSCKAYLYFSVKKY